MSSSTDSPVPVLLPWEDVVRDFGELAYLSAATDFDISQVVDVVKGVHARVRTDDFALVRP